MNATFSIQRGHTGREVMAIVSTADWLGASVVWEVSPSVGTIPIGTVEFCEKTFGPNRKAFYPAFLRHLMLRDFEREKWGQLGASSFVKDATAWKSDFVSGIRPPGFILPPGDWWLSEPVPFRDEWRYYVADGSIVATGWYAGHDEDEPAPTLPVEWPAGFSGAVDFGRLDDGRLALVEAHAPFACGWYGEDHRDYALWQALAWESADWWRTNPHPASEAEGFTPPIPK